MIISRDKSFHFSFSIFWKSSTSRAPCFSTSFSWPSPSSSLSIFFSKSRSFDLIRSWIVCRFKYLS